MHENDREKRLRMDEKRGRDRWSSCMCTRAHDLPCSAVVLGRRRRRQGRRVSDNDSGRRPPARPLLLFLLVLLLYDSSMVDWSVLDAHVWHAEGKEGNESIAVQVEGVLEKTPSGRVMTA